MNKETKLFDDTAEQAILGAILYSASDCIDKVRLTGLKEDDFTSRSIEPYIIPSYRWQMTGCTLT